AHTRALRGTPRRRRGAGRAARAGRGAVVAAHPRRAVAVRRAPVREGQRGAVWTPVDFVGLAPSEEELRGAIEQAREGGMNMLRLPGTGAYESAAFHD